MSLPDEWGYSVARSYPLEDIEVRRGGDGRTVEAYAAIWDTPTEIRDQHGHYYERIARTAFDKTIRERGDRPIPVFYNHGMTAQGSPSDMYSVPIGRSIEVRAEARGLWTLSRYNDGPDVDRIVEAIRNGAITSQSFRGRIYKSDPPGPKIRPGRDGRVPTVTRTELGLTEYGPTPSAAYVGAAILALRSGAEATATLQAAGYDMSRLHELALPSTTSEEKPETDVATSDVEAGADEPLIVQDVTHSGRFQELQKELRALGVLE
jgi:HK97 family phage prohead protease